MSKPRLGMLSPIETILPNNTVNISTSKIWWEGTTGGENASIWSDWKQTK